MAEYFHFAVAWDWEPDHNFISILEEEVHGSGFLFYSISHHNTHETIRKVQKRDLVFGAFLDRAGDANESFVALAKAMRRVPLYYINPPEAIVHANDKATMHLEFISAGLQVPFSIIVSPYNKRREIELKLSDIARLGRPFIIKPANTTGGGIGVITGAETLKDVIESRQHHKNDKYLLQEKLAPAIMGGMKGWFRVFYVCGLVIPCWWDDETHIYTTIDSPELERYSLHPLADITKTIHDVCKLDFFSTEIVLTANQRYVVVDYVNDVCDMRLQTKAIDGVPDHIVRTIAMRIARTLPALVQNPTTQHPT